MDKGKTGFIIREARQQKGYTQQELGDMVGVSNKAVSRWENGESFPDIALLDVIAQALELNVEEIVLGERKKEASRATVEELVRVARMQERQRKRKTMVWLLLGGIFLLIVCQTMRTFLYVGNGAQNTVYVFSLGIIFVALTVFLESRQALTFRLTEKPVKIAGLVSVLSGAYLVLLFPLTVWIYEGGKFLAEHEVSVICLEGRKCGPMLAVQLLAVFFLNLALALYLIGKSLRENGKISIVLYVSIAVSHLALAYGNLLHQLTGLDKFISIYLTDTVVILVETGAALLLAAAWQRRKKGKI